MFGLWLGHSSTSMCFYPNHLTTSPVFAGSDRFSSVIRALGDIVEPNPALNWTRTSSLCCLLGSSWWISCVSSQFSVPHMWTLLTNYVTSVENLSLWVLFRGLTVYLFLPLYSYILLCVYLLHKNPIKCTEISYFNMTKYENDVSEGKALEGIA